MTKAAKAVATQDQSPEEILQETRAVSGSPILATDDVLKLKRGTPIVLSWYEQGQRHGGAIIRETETPQLTLDLIVPLQGKKKLILTAVEGYRKGVLHHLVDSHGCVYEVRVPNEAEMASIARQSDKDWRVRERERPTVKEFLTVPPAPKPAPKPVVQPKPTPKPAVKAEPRKPVKKAAQSKPKAPAKPPKKETQSKPPAAKGTGNPAARTLKDPMRPFRQGTVKADLFNLLRDGKVHKLEELRSVARKASMSSSLVGVLTKQLRVWNLAVIEKDTIRLIGGKGSAHGRSR